MLTVRKEFQEKIMIRFSNENVFFWLDSAKVDFYKLENIIIEYVENLHNESAIKRILS